MCSIVQQISIMQHLCVLMQPFVVEDSIFVMVPWQYQQCKGMKVAITIIILQLGEVEQGSYTRQFRDKRIYLYT